MKLLQIATVIQWLVMLPILLRFLLEPADLGTVGLWFVTAAIAVVTLPYGLWQLLRYPPRRAWAGAMVATALLCLATPMVMSELALGPVPPGFAVGLVLGATLLASVWLIRSRAFAAPQGADSDRLQRYITAALLVAMALVALPLLAAALFGLPVAGDANISTRHLDVLLIVSAIVGPVAALLATAGLLYSLVGLWRDAGARVRHGANSGLALVLAAMLAALATLVAIRVVNPG